MSQPKQQSNKREYKKPPMNFRLVAIQDNTSSTARWVVNTAVKPEPGLEIEFTVEPINP